jgi:DinB superfamily
MPDTTPYLDRIRSFAAGKDPLVMQREAPEVIAMLIEAVPDDRLKQRLEPQKWSIVEIVAHLAEDELVTSWRYRQMLERPGCALAGFDQDLWEQLGKYGTWSVDEALGMFRLLRKANLRLLQDLSPEQWQAFGVHAERGRITVHDLAFHMAGHDLNHVEQIRRILG